MRPGHASRNEPNQPAQRQLKFRSDRFARFERNSFLLEDDKPVPLGTRALEILIALLGFTALRAEKTACSSTSPMCQSARTRARADRKSTRLNSSHLGISYAVLCL